MDDRTEQQILEKAQYVRDAVTVLAEKRDTLTFDTYRASREDRDVVERESETTIEACLDIGRMVLKANGDELPSTNAGIFRELGTRGILDSDTAQRMAQAAGFRNILSHRYGTRSTTKTYIISYNRNSHCSTRTSTNSKLLRRVTACTTSG